MFAAQEPSEKLLQSVRQPSGSLQERYSPITFSSESNPSVNIRKP